MLVANREYSRESLYRRCADTGILYGARRMTFTDGYANGLRVIDVRTAGGLRLLLSEDRCLDILELSYMGHNIGLMTVNGPNSNTYGRPSSDFEEFKRVWSGGALSTCGLRNTGLGCESEGEWFPVHDTIGFTPATQVGIEVTGSDDIVITGSIVERSLGYYCLELRRTITIPADSASISVRDTIFNRHCNDELIFLLYHINFGFPFVSEDLEMEWPQGLVTPRDDYSAPYIGSHNKMTAPEDNVQDQYFFHQMKDNSAEVHLHNNALGISAKVSYETANLPYLVQWKGMASGHYALGVELSTSTISNRSQALNEGYQTSVKAFGSLEFGFDLNFYETKGGC